MVVAPLPVAMLATGLNLKLRSHIGLKKRSEASQMMNPSGRFRCSVRPLPCRWRQDFNGVDWLIHVEQPPAVSAGTLASPGQSSGPQGQPQSGRVLAGAASN